jgi:hypothetical protein
MYWSYSDTVLDHKLAIMGTPNILSFVPLKTSIIFLLLQLQNSLGGVCAYISNCSMGKSEKSHHLKVDVNMPQLWKAKFSILNTKPLSRERISNLQWEICGSYYFFVCNICYIESTLEKTLHWGCFCIVHCTG